MATVISSESVESHMIDKYNFKVLSTASSSKTTEQASALIEETPKVKIKDVDSSALSNSSKESLIESLMQKTDEMSSNFIKLQMKLESKEEEYTQKLAKAKEEAFAEGLEAGVAKAATDYQAESKKSLELFAASVQKLETSATEFESALEGIKKELIIAALDIAKEVIKVELNQSSDEIAKILSDDLIADLQGASKIKLKVNPKNHGAVSEHVGKLAHISVISDSAVTEGGVIVMSDAGNIDSQISKRFERVKRAALGE